MPENNTNQPSFAFLIIVAVTATVVGGLALDWIRDMKRDKRELGSEDG